jgi:hypothetical protein
MTYQFNFCRLPDNSELVLKIEEACIRLNNKLHGFEVKNLEISDYNKRYFGNIVKNLKASLQLRHYILAWVLDSISIPLKDVVFVDYGGGSGMMSLLAKELGIGTIIYNDIYGVSCHDAKVIANSIGNSADYYIHGVLEDVISFANRNQIHCHAAASYDVIEHIYDIESFFQKLHLLSNGPMSVMMCSGANMVNPRQRKLLMKLQIETEYKDRPTKWGKKPTDCLHSYLKVRRGMIEKYLQQLKTTLDEETVEQLARRTRGKIEPDIQKSVSDYLKTRQLPLEPQHPTNTCDPYNGNWAEHLLDPYHLANILQETGFESQVLPGFYGAVHHPFKRWVGECLNLPIMLLGKNGLLLSPFYGIHGVKRS